MHFSKFTEAAGEFDEKARTTSMFAGLSARLVEEEGAASLERQGAIYKIQHLVMYDPITLRWDFTQL